MQRNNLFTLIIVCVYVISSSDIYVKAQDKLPFCIYKGAAYYAGYYVPVSNLDQSITCICFQYQVLQCNVKLGYSKLQRSDCKLRNESYVVGANFTRKVNIGTTSCTCTRFQILHCYIYLLTQTAYQECLLNDIKYLVGDEIDLKNIFGIGTSFCFCFNSQQIECEVTSPKSKKVNESCLYNNRTIAVGTFFADINSVGIMSCKCVRNQILRCKITIPDEDIFGYPTFAPPGQIKKCIADNGEEYPIGTVVKSTDVESCYCRSSGVIECIEKAPPPPVTKPSSVTKPTKVTKPRPITTPSPVTKPSPVTTPSPITKPAQFCTYENKKHLVGKKVDLQLTKNGNSSCICGFSLTIECKIVTPEANETPHGCLFDDKQIGVGNVLSSLTDSFISCRCVQKQLFQCTVASG